MKILFIDIIDWDFDVATPLERPLGGSQSCLCYLTRELLERGHEVALICGTSRPSEILGIPCTSYREISADYIRQFERIVVLNGPAEVCRQIRPHMADGVPLVLWTQHAHDQPAMQMLRDPEIRASWDRIVCVTDLHRKLMTECYGLDPGRVCVIKNAMSPLFEGLFEHPAELRRSKPPEPILAFTSTPFRGLDLLLYAFPILRAEFRDLKLHVYSSMSIYQQQNDPYTPLYQHCRSLPGCLYVGSINQPRLAAELRRAAILAYCNSFAEMACVAVMEAMAAGMYVVTSDLGALSDTLMGYGTLIAPVSDDDPSLSGASLIPYNIPGCRMPTLAESSYVGRYVAAMRNVLVRRAEDPVAFYDELWQQIQAARAHYNWRTRAAEWEAFLA